MSKSGRAFTISVKPAWPKEKIMEWLAEHKGGLKAYVITHDKDENPETGEIVEPHTHFYIEYDTPRKISTVANLFKVETNFVELVSNRKGMLRYLTHLDQETKAKYDSEDVYTNADLDYRTAVLGSGLTDKEIAEYLRDGRGIELLGIVPAGRLRTIQAFLHYDQSKTISTEITRLNFKIDKILAFTEKCSKMADDLALSLRSVGSSFEVSAKELADALRKIKYITI